MKIEATEKTPYIELDLGGVLTFKGRSIPEDSISFYAPILNWVKEYSINPSNNTQINIELEYFNTSSSKCLLDVFKAVKPLTDKSEIIVNWHYEDDDEDMLEAGEDYEAISGLTFKMVKVDSL